MNRRIIALTLAGSLGLGLAGCSGTDASNPDSTDTVQVSASFYPLAWLAEQIGGTHVKVTSVTPAGVEPHDYELSPKEVAELAKTDLLVYVEGFQSSLDEAAQEIAEDKRVELSSDVDLLARAETGATGHHHHGEGEAEHDDAEHDDHADAEHDEHEHSSHSDEDLDPHFWLDPARMAAAAKAIEARLEKADAAHATDYKANLDSVTGRLEELRKKFEAGLASCERKEAVVNHTAFGYLLNEFGITQVGVSGIDPEAEPAPATVAEVKKVIEDSGATTLYTEELASTKVIDTIAKETGAQTLMLSPLEAQTDEGDYISRMEQNLANLQKGLGCSDK